MTPAERDRLYKAMRGRLSHDDSLKDLADRAGVGRNTLYKWTRDSVLSDPSWESLRRIAAALDLRLWELVREVELEPWERSTI